MLKQIHDFGGNPTHSHEKKMADSGTSMSVRKGSSWILFICGDLKNVLAVQVNNVEVAS